jgi:hypothetical protein
MTTIEATRLAWRETIAREMVAIERQIEPANESARAAQAAADAAREEFRRLEASIAGNLRKNEPIADALRIRIAMARQARDAVIGQWSRAKAEAANIAARARDLREAIEQIDRAVSPPAPATIEPDAGRPLHFPRRATGPAVEISDTIEFPTRPAA